MRGFFENNCNIQHITYENWDDFITSKDFVFIMFYHPTNTDSWNVKDHYATASQVTNRDGVTWAAVNCLWDRKLCNQETAVLYPDFGVYFQGKKLHMFSDPNATSQSLRTFVENYPIPSNVSTPERKAQNRRTWVYPNIY